MSEQRAYQVGADGRLRPAVEVAVDADRTPTDPGLVAGPPTPDPWQADPRRWAGTEPAEVAGQGGD